MRKYIARLYSRVYNDEPQDFCIEVENDIGRKCVFDYSEFFMGQYISPEYYKFFNRIGDVYYNHIFRDIVQVDEIYSGYRAGQDRMFKLIDEVEYYLPD
jgi:hypothetical protein